MKILSMPRYAAPSIAALVAAATFTVAGDSAACGGTFCDSGPTAMPVDQSGENILFVLDGTSVEAHVQIQYKGDPTRFAWVVPMPAVPTVTVGSEQLFDSLLTATVPSFGLSQSFDSCPCPTCGGPNGGATGAGGASSYVGADAGAGVQVILQKTVGAFDVTALQGHSAQEVTDWLTANGYASVATAPALLDSYVQKGSVFVAVKLTASAGVNQIHPLVFKYTGTEPCIPLKLTSIAAVEDMGIRAFFLGDDRVVPTNYQHVTPNPARFDWSNNVNNYASVVSRAVDEAGGRAFMTEYAGPSNIVYSGNLSNGVWDESAFSGIDPRDVVDALSSQGLIQCYQGQPGYCTPQHPLILPLLEEFLPAPAGVDENDFYSCVSCYETDAGARAFSATAFAQALSDRIFAPGRHAAAVLARFPYLTRLFTTISPSEMTDDPLFATRTTLGGVSVQALFGNQRTAQNGQSGVTLPDGRVVGLDSGKWPAFSSAMPWTERIESFATGTAPTVVANNTKAIDTALDTWNTSVGWPAPPPVCGTGGFGGTGGEGPAPGSGGRSSVGFPDGGSSGGTGGFTGDGLLGNSPPGGNRSLSGSSGGCSVASGADARTSWFAALASLAALSGRARRRRAATRR